MAELSVVATNAYYNRENAIHISAESTVNCKQNTFSFGATFAEVEVDTELGTIKIIDIINVHDSGRIINPATAMSQVHGGMSMSIGFGLSEQLLYDEKTGKPLNDNLLDYKLATMMDHPKLEAQFVENPEPTSAYGTKALGEPPTVPAAPAIRNAIFHATGVSINKLPMNPHVLIPAFQEVGLI